MIYTDRLAVVNPTTPTISLVMAEVVIPALPEADGLPVEWQNQVPVVSGSTNYWTGVGAPLFAKAYTDSDFLDLFAVKIMAVGNHDYCIREAGTIPGTSFSFNAINGYYSQAYAGMNEEDGSDDDHRLMHSVIQPLGPATGGVTTGISLSSVVAEDVDFGAGTNVASYLHFMWTGPAIGSSIASPKGLFCFALRNADSTLNQVGAVRFDGTTHTVVGLFNLSDTDYNDNAGICAVITDTSHYILTSVEDAPNTLFTVVLAITEEQAFPATVFDIYRPGFDDPALPATYRLLALGAVNGDSLYEHYVLNACGTELGFLITYIEADGPVYKPPKFLLVAKDWTTFQWITITGDATTDTILAQAQTQKIGLTYSDGVYSLLGGTSDAPLLVQTTGGSGGDALVGTVLRCDDGIWNVTAVDGNRMTLDLREPPRRIIRELEDEK